MYLLHLIISCLLFNIHSIYLLYLSKKKKRIKCLNAKLESFSQILNFSHFSLSLVWIPHLHMLEVNFRCSPPGACLPADTCWSQGRMSWETGSGRWPVPAWQLYRMSAAWAQHRADRYTGTTVMWLTWTFSLSSCNAVTTHGVRARQDQDYVILLVASWAVRKLRCTIFSLILLSARFFCFNIRKLLLSPRIESPSWHCWQSNKFHWFFLCSCLVKKVRKGNLSIHVLKILVLLHN